MNVMTQFSAARDYGRDLRFQAMFDGAAIGIAICQLDGRIWEANPALSRMLGYSQQELAGAHAGELYSDRPESLPETGCISDRARIAEATGPAGWMMVFRWVSS